MAGASTDLERPSDPRKVAGGRLGARRRWGPPRTIDLRSIDAAQRAFIVELVDVAKRNAVPRDPIVQTRSAVDPD